MSETSAPLPQKYMRPRQFGPRVGIPFSTIYDFIRRGILPSYRLGHCVLIDIDEADAIIRGLERVQSKLPRKPKAARKMVAPSK